MTYLWSQSCSWSVRNDQIFFPFFTGDPHGQLWIFICLYIQQIFSSPGDYYFDAERRDLCYVWFNNFKVIL